jgi:hypothetical protein
MMATTAELAASIETDRKIVRLSLVAAIGEARIHSQPWAKPVKIVDVTAVDDVPRRVHGTTLEGQEFVADLLSATWPDEERFTAVYEISNVL